MTPNTQWSLRDVFWWFAFLCTWNALLRLGSVPPVYVLLTTGWLVVVIVAYHLWGRSISAVVSVLLGWMLMGMDLVSQNQSNPIPRSRVAELILFGLITTAVMGLILWIMVVISGVLLGYARRCLCRE